MSELAMSFSRLNTFEQCEAKFDYLYVSKVVKDEFGEASAYGDRVHKTLEAYGKREIDTDNLTLEQSQTVKRWGPLVDFLLAKTDGVVLFEEKLTVDNQLKQVDWYSKSAYIRAIVDLLIIDGDTAYCFDYKTGKQKDDDTQLKLFAAMVMWVYPQVKTVKTAYLWLMTNKKTSALYTRKDLDKLWATLRKRFDKVAITVDAGYFQPTPSGLCGYCPAKKICPDAKTRR